MREWILHWGYLAVLLGTSLEGEAILLLAGLFAHDGFLRLDLVMVCGFAGSVLADQLWFWIGRRFGRGWIERHPGRTRGLRRVADLLDRWGSFYVLIFRFLYGLRTVSPIAIGLTSISSLRFTLLNLAAAALWSVLISGLGYLCGGAIEMFVQSLPLWQRGLAAAAVIALVIGGLWLLERRFLGPPDQSGGGQS